MKRALSCAAAFLALAATLGARCEAPELLAPDRNRPPDTFLTRGPEENEVAYFRTHLFWRGYDPDGTVAQWQFAIDDTVIRPEAVVVGTGWIRTTKADSVFIFRASSNGTDQQLEHRFFIASIDNEGKPDPTPAVLDFSARTVAYPIPEVTRAWAITTEGDSVPIGEGDTVRVFSTVTLCWGGTDPDGEILKMSYKLDPLDLGFTTIPMGTRSCATYENLRSNGSRESYVFLLTAEDDAGSRNLRPVERRFVVNYDPNTEIVRFYSQALSLGPSDREIVPGDTIADSSRVFFEWVATDVDGAIKGAFWAIDGLNLRSDPGLQDSADVRSAFADKLTSDVGTAVHLIVGSFDEYGRAEGSPDSIPFFVDFPPRVVITQPATVTVPPGRHTIKWQGIDVDGTTSQIEYDLEILPPPGSGLPQITTTIDCILQDEYPQDFVRAGLWTIRVTPTDRCGQGKTGRPAEKTVVVTPTAGGTGQ